VTGARDPCRAMYLQAEVLVADERGLAGVQADPHTHRAALRPLVRVQCRLDGRRPSAGLQRTAEHDEEGIALGPQFVAAVGRQRFPQDAVMCEEDVRVALAELLDQPGRSLDVTEEKRDRAGWQRAHAGDADVLRTGSRISLSWRSWSGPSNRSSGSGASRCSL